MMTRHSMDGPTPAPHLIIDLPAEFRPLHASLMKAADTPQIALYSPPFETLGRRQPGAFVAVTSTRWIMAFDDEPIGTTTTASFDDTLLVELSAILLAGSLKIDYRVGDERDTSVSVAFSTLLLPRFQQATHFVLAGMEPPRPTVDEHVEDARTALMRAWPMKFRNVALDRLPSSSRVLAATYWPVVIGGFSRELAPAAALLITERELVLVSDEQATSRLRGREGIKDGTIVTYVPMSRLANITVRPHGRLCKLELATRHDGATLEIPFGADHEPAVREIAAVAKAKLGLAS